MSGGKENLLVNICAANSESTHSMAVIIINDNIDPYILSRLKKTKTQVFSIERKPGKSIISAINRIRRIVNTLKPDIIHTHENLSAILGVLASFNSGSKRVHTLHCGNVYAFSLKERITKWIQGNSIHEFIAISPSVKQDFLKRCPVNPARITEAHNGIPLDRFSNSTDVSSHGSIVCIARLDHIVKGQDILIRAIAILKNNHISCTCRFVGDGESRNFLENLTAELGLAPDIEFLGTRSDVPDLIADAGMAVLPSRHEGFGIAAIEAMACGRPVIASAVGGLKDLIEHGKNGLLFEPDNPQDLAAQIQRLLEDSNLCKFLVKCGLETAKACSIENMNERYMSVYRHSVSAAD